jgi:hypothetical protein
MLMDFIEKVRMGFDYDINFWVYENYCDPKIDQLIWCYYNLNFL